MTRPHRGGARVLSLLTLLIPLVIVGAAAMAISYATLIDVARTNGLPLPELFPVLIDVGTVACMVAAAQFQTAGISGKWLAYLAFASLSLLSVFANATHAAQHADLTATSLGVAATLAATPPAALLAITHLVMKLIPATQRASAPMTATSPTPTPSTLAEPVSTVDTTGAPLALDRGTSSIEDDVARWVLDEHQRTGRRPTGAEVGQRLGGKSPKTGQRFLRGLELREQPILTG